MEPPLHACAFDHTSRLGRVLTAPWRTFKAVGRTPRRRVHDRQRKDHAGERVRHATVVANGKKLVNREWGMGNDERFPLARIRTSA